MTKVIHSLKKIINKNKNNNRVNKFYELFGLRMALFFTKGLDTISLKYEMSGDFQLTEDV